MAQDVTPMDAGQLREAMGRFGFQDREARLYLLLLRRGRATARALTLESGIDRVLAYRTLDGMHARGLVQVTAERPRRYVALSPTVLLERSITERRRSLAEDVELARTLAEQLPQVTAAILEGAPRFQLITGTAATYPFIREMLARAEHDVSVLMTYRAFRESVAARTFEPLAPFVRGGGRFRLVIEDDPRLPATLRPFDAARRRYDTVEVRTFGPQRARMTVVDAKEALVFVVPEANRSSLDEVALWTDTADFARAQQAHFESLWDRAQPALGPARYRRTRARRTAKPGSRPRPRRTH
jgi:sugar-specific transcriptional regulator TrmB